MLYAPDGSVAGGLIGATFWDWFYIELLFVKEELRQQGYGRQLLDLAEAEAARRGAKNAYLDTFSFQAPDFYTRQGYRAFGELPEFPRGHSRIFLTKGLSTAVNGCQRITRIVYNSYVTKDKYMVGRRPD